ncbi:McKusick-Kaufman/Bardet-Biedl syndromes putative chaperonin [Polypterus senegalus]
MSRLEVQRSALCLSDPLSDGNTQQQLSELEQIFASCYGPCGQLKQIHNNRGGHVQTTSTALVLLRGVPVSDPLLKLLCASVLNHISRFSDCGLFTSILGCHLIQSALQLNFHSNTIVRIFKHLLGDCIHYLNSDSCACKLKIDFSSTQVLLSLARSIIVSKPACLLNSKEVQHISCLLLKAFLHTIPCHIGGNTLLGKTIVHSIEGHRADKSSLFPGLLLDLLDTCPNFVHTKLPSRSIKVMVFSASLSGDLPEAVNGGVEACTGVSPEAVLLESLLTLGSQLIADDVDLLVCQKVVHPALKQQLKKHNVIVVDRLGHALMEPLTQITGATAIASFQTAVPRKCYGQLKGLDLVSVASKRLLHLIPFEDSCVYTLVLCNRNETTLNELKIACQAAEHVLKLTLKDQFALLGGGCTEAHLSAYIRNKVTSEMNCELADLDCTATEYMVVARCFCSSLEHVARALDHEGRECLIDLSHGHKWIVSANEPISCKWSDLVTQCACGSIEKSNSMNWVVLDGNYDTFSPKLIENIQMKNIPECIVLDSFAAKMNALQVAVETASLVLDFNYVVKDVN